MSITANIGNERRDLYMCLKFDIQPASWACSYMHEVRWKRLGTLIKNNRLPTFYNAEPSLPLLLLGFFSFKFERGMRSMTLYMFSELF